MQYTRKVLRLDISISSCVVSPHPLFRGNMCDSSGLRRFELAVFLYLSFISTNNLKPTNDHGKTETCDSARVCAPLRGAKAGMGRGGRAAPSPLVEARSETVGVGARPPSRVFWKCLEGRWSRERGGATGGAPRGEGRSPALQKADRREARALSVLSPRRLDLPPKRLELCLSHRG